MDLTIKRISLVTMLTLTLSLLVPLSACDDDAPGPTPDSAVDATTVDGPNGADGSTADAPPADAPPADAPLADAPTADAPLPDAPLADAPPPPDLTVDGVFLPDGPSPTLTADQILKGCMIFGSCLPDDGVNDCLRDYFLNGKEIDGKHLACLASSKGCGALKGCLGVWVSLGTCTSKGQTCSGTTTLVHCDPPMATHVDCAWLFGGSCSNDECVSGASCTAAGCKGDNSTDCKSGVEVFSEPCATMGLKCKAGACVGPQEACSASACEAPNTAKLCVKGFAKRIDCSKLGSGFSCKQSALGARCVQTTTDCNMSAAKGKETCDGDKLVVCHGDKLTKVDCKALGFSGCGKHGCTP